jgi:probable phosphomutase (TIGR03848 family)
MTTFLLIRHAATDLVDHTLAGRGPGVHLNDEGRRQAERLAVHLAREPIRAIYSGPLERARETAQPLGDRLGLQPQVAEALDEFNFGDWTGRMLNELAQVPRWHRFNTFRSGIRAPGGELMLEVQSRIVAFMQRLHEQSPDQTLALVSHGDVIRAAVLHSLGAPLDCFLRVEISPASVSAIRIGDYGPQILSLNHVVS